MNAYLTAPRDRAEELKRLYQACFDEKDEAVRILFEEYGLVQYCHAALCGGEIAATLYLLPAQAAETAARYRRITCSRRVRFRNTAAGGS